MGKVNNSLRIRTDVGKDKFITVNLDSEYDTLEILSLKINQRGQYRYHTSTYGVVVGRVLANNGFGVPNAKLSLFIAKDENASVVENAIYPFTSVGSKNSDGIRYNLLPSNQKDDCHQVVGTFPSKRMVLDDGSVLEVFDKYYLYTTRTNEAGDYMFFGVPTGTYNLHMDLDISDCGKLSQRPRDFLYKGYNLDQFENPNQFKIDTELATLPQIFTQDTTIEVKPFWGDEDEGTNIGITREDINVNYKFEPTCVFMGSIISDTPNDGISKRCVPTNRMGDMRELVTGSGTIEIIRKKVDNTIEELQIKGKQLINGNGVWCFQIPMNLDYVMTDEYGNMVPTDNPEKGIPTRCEVRFRMSLDTTQSENDPYKRGKVLVPNNPMETSTLEPDYEFGSKTSDESFKSLMWNGVYSVKSFIPRFQKARNIKTNKFTGIKNVNINGGNSPMPYNNIRIKIPFMFWLLCNVAKLFIRIVQFINSLKVALMSASLNLINLPYSYISNELCPDLEYWYFAPGMNTKGPANTVLRKFWKWLTGRDNRCKKWQHESVCLTFQSIANEIIDEEGSGGSKEEVFFQYMGEENNTSSGKVLVLTESEFNAKIPTGTTYVDLTVDNANENATFTNDYNKRSSWAKIASYIDIKASPDRQSTEVKNALNDISPRIKLTPDVSYLMQCVEMNLAQEYEVIKFDFYNDWINGVIYLPRWARDVKFKRKRKNGKKVIVEKVKGCINDVKRWRGARRYVQQCSLEYNSEMKVNNAVGCRNGTTKLRCHQKDGMDHISVFGTRSGAVQEQKTILGDYVYYMKPNEGETLLFATDIIMLGTLFDCDENGIPSTFESLAITTYKMPTNMALTNVDNESDSYVGGEATTDEDGNNDQNAAPTIDTVKSWSCGNTCVLDYIAESGVTKTIPSYEEILAMTKEMEGEKAAEQDVVLPYEDIFPMTEMSGIEWGYTGPGQGDATSDKMYAPGGHFMGLSCGNAETNIRSCVNLKRACEIGTTLSEHFEIPIGYKDMDGDSNFDVVNYLFISPNGFIAKDQIEDVTFRSAFATMNQNNLKTEVDNVTKHKKYVFEYLLPDSFDGSLSKELLKYSEYNQRINLDWDDYWTEVAAKDKEHDYQTIWKTEAVLEEGYTINRVLETKSNDYIKFRHFHDATNNPLFLKGSRMPVYRNSFYFYFGLKEGYTALDEFKLQFFAPCAKALLVGSESNFTYSVNRTDTLFKYNITVNTSNMDTPIRYKLTKSNTSNETSEQYEYNDVEREAEGVDFVLENVPIGVHTLKIVDNKGVEIIKEVRVGVDEFTVRYDETTIVNYEESETRTDLDSFANSKNNGGSINGTFDVIDSLGSNWGSSSTAYTIKITNTTNSISVSKNDSVNWNKMYDTNTNRLWLWGAGDYNIYIMDSTGSRIYLYDKFTVNNGVIPPVIMLGSGYTYDSTWDGIDSLADIMNKNDFVFYKLLVNNKPIGNPFTLNLRYYGENTGNFQNIYVGRGEKYKTEEEMYDLSSNVDLNDNFKNEYLLDFGQIFSPSDYSVGDVTRGKFYYTAYNPSKKVYASETKKVDYTSGSQMTVEVGSDWEYAIVQNGNKKKILEVSAGMVIVPIDDLEIQPDTTIRIGKLIGLPVYNNPFAYKVIALLTNDSNSFRTMAIKSQNVQCYQNSLKYSLTDDNNLFITEYKESDDASSKTYAPFNVTNEELVMKYSHDAKTSSVKFILENINSWNDNKHGIFMADGSEIFNSNGQFKNVTTWNDNQLGTHGNEFNVDYDSTNGNTYAFYSLSFVSIDANKDYWSFVKYKESEGNVDTIIYKNDYQEFNIIKPSTTVTFVNSGCEFLKNVEVKNECLGETYQLYEWDDTDESFALNEDTRFKTVNIYKSGGGFKVEVSIGSNNDYRYGDIFSQNIEPDYIGGALGGSTILGDGFTTSYSKNEEGKENMVELKFSNFNLTIVSTPKEETPDATIAGDYTLVLVAKNNDTVVEHTKDYGDGFIFSLSWEKLASITSFELMIVENYPN